MTDFSKRSSQKELLDRDDIPFKDISRNMIELEFINRYLGGHQITISGLRKILDHKMDDSKPIHICEIGCGGGDNMKAIEKWCSTKNIRVKFTGIDINNECIQHAKLHCDAMKADWIINDYRNVEFDQKPDIIFTSLFCHHFSNEELICQLQWMNQHSSLGFFINDLHRHPLAYYSIKLLTRIFSKSYLVKNDAPLSVLRGFSRNDWTKILDQCDLKTYSIRWKWAFRWLITLTK